MLDRTSLPPLSPSPLCVISSWQGAAEAMLRLSPLLLLLPSLSTRAIPMLEMGEQERCETATLSLLLRSSKRVPQAQPGLNL